MHDRIKIRIAYPLRILWFTIMIRKWVGFAFTNLSIFLFREENGIKDSDQYKAWVKKNGQAAFINEMLYCAAKAWCMNNHEKENFTKVGLLTGVALSPQSVQEKIMKKWQNSETFGMPEVKKKSTKK